jgi:hypothetical protein
MWRDVESPVFARLSVKRTRVISRHLVEIGPRMVQGALDARAKVLMLPALNSLAQI